MDIKKIIYRTGIVACTLAVVGTLWYENTVTIPKREAAWETKTTIERMRATPICLNGVEYW
jgi:hypothetical protein